MPRLNNGQELFRKLDTLTVFRQAGSTQTTTAAAVTAAQATVNFTATTGFTANDAVIIAGANGAELNAITAVTPQTAVPLLYPAVVPQAAGAQVFRAVATVLGEIEEAGIRLSGSAPLTPINSALRGTPVGYIYGQGELQAALGLLGFNGLNLQTMFGITEAEIGSGTTAAPFAVAVLGQNIGTQGIQCVRATGTRADGATVILDFNDCRIEPQGEIPLQRTAAVPLPINLRFTSLVYRQIA